MAADRVIILVLSTVFCFYILQAFIRFLHKVWWTPMKLQAKMRAQGIKGPPYRFPYGNAKEVFSMRSQSMKKPMDISHDILPRLQPHVYAWTKTYGKNFVNWNGSKCELFVTEAGLIKDVLMNREGTFPKPDLEGLLKKHLGESVITNEGEKWAKIRKLANHTFHSESLKGMVPAMVSSVSTMLERWKCHEGGEINVFDEFRLLTSEVISRTAFGSSYVEGQHIFEMIAKSRAMAARNMYNAKVPGIISMFAKSDDEVEADRLQKRIKSSILEIVKKRQNREGGIEGFGDDYLGQLINEYDVRKGITIGQMIDEIKATYEAGHITTSTLLSWCILLLALNTNWQEKAREEVNKIFNGNTPHSDGIVRLKIMNMIIKETLRLYPPAILVARKVAKETKIGAIDLPPNMNIVIPILALHHDPQIWGKDVHLFRPDRFAEGLAEASNSNTAAFLPFSLGPRTCAGLNFANIEAKIAVSMILQKYRFTLSPNYVHNPAEVLVLIPKNGVQIILNRI